MDSFDAIQPIVMLAIFAAVIYFQVGRRRAARNAWAREARRLDLNFSSDGLFGQMQMFGQMDGVMVHARTERRGGGKNSSSWTVFSADIGAGLPPGLFLSREGMGAKLLKLIGTQDIQLGDAALDDMLLVQGGSAGRVRELLRRPDVRAALGAFFSGSGDASVREEQVILEERGVRTTGIATSIRAVWRVAKAMQGDPPPATRETQSTIPTPPPPPTSDDPAALPEFALDELLPASALTPLPPLRRAPPSDAIPASLLAPPPPLDPAATLPPRTAARPRTTAPATLRTPVPAPPAPPTPEATAPALLPATRTLLDELQAPRTMSTRRDAILAELHGHLLSLDLVVSEVRWTSGLFLPAPLQRGRTARGAACDQAWSVRLPETWNERADALKPGESLTIRGRISAWDSLHREPIVDAYPDTPG